MRIAMIDGGTYYHHRTLHDPDLTPSLAGGLYAPELIDADLRPYDCLYVGSRQDASDLQRAAPRLRAFLDDGGTIVATSDTEAETWVPGVQWQPTPINFWWWLTPGASSGLRVSAPSHPMFDALSLGDATWHHHGVLTPPAGAVSLIDADDGGSILYDDTVSTGGRLIVTTLDPCYHHGSYFMPATTRFLKKFLPWLAAQPRYRPAAVT